MKKKNKKRALALKKIFRFNAGLVLTVVLFLVLLLGVSYYPNFLKTKGAPISITNTFNGGIDDSEEVVNALANSTWNKYLDSEDVIFNSDEGKMELAEKISEWEGVGFNISGSADNIDENPVIYPDMIGGSLTGDIFVVWESHGVSDTNYSIKVMKISSDGTPLMGWNPVLLVSSNKQTQNPVAVSDNMGGLIVAWEDTRDQTNTQINIYAKRINSSGNNIWEVAVSGVIFDQRWPQIISDENNGAIISWKDFADTRVKAQRVNGACNNPDFYLCWDGGNDGVGGYYGLMIADYFSDADVVPMISDGTGTGGAIVAWVDNNDTVTQHPNTYNVYVQRIDGDGDPQWNPARGIKASQSFGASQTFPRVTTDGLTGVIIFWKSNDKLYAQKINTTTCAGTNNRCWGAEGVEISNHNPLGSYVDPYNNFKAIDDGNNGVAVVWQENNGFDIDIYAQKVNESCVADDYRCWDRGAGDYEGLPIVTADGDQERMAVNRDANNFYFSWSDKRTNKKLSGIPTVFAQNVRSSDGSLQYKTDGIELNFEKMSGEESPYISYVGISGGIICSYTDNPSVPPYDIYIQKIGAKDFFPNGVITSSIYDFGQKVNWGNFGIDVDLPEKVFLETRISQDGIVWSSWSNSESFPSTKVLPVSSLPARYIQYRLTLTHGSTPKLNSITLSGAPTLPPTYAPPVQEEIENPVVQKNEMLEEISEELDICTPNTLPEIQATPLPSFNPIWGTTYAPTFDRIKWAYDHRSNIYNEYVSLLKRKPCTREVNWWLQKEPNIFTIRYLILNSDEYRAKQGL